MGMFDSIKCEYLLPFPEDLKGLTKEKLIEEVYQTKDFDNSMDYYIIKSDGTLWHEEYDIEDQSDPNAEGFERFIGCMTRVNKRMVQMTDYTGTINFYSYIERDSLSYDFWIEYKTVFVDGKVVNFKLEKYEASDNNPRKASNEKFKNEMKAHNKLWGKWYMKYLYKHYDTLIRKIFRLWNRISNKLPPAYKVERFFRPL